LLITIARLRLRAAPPARRSASTTIVATNEPLRQLLASIKNRSDVPGDGIVKPIKSRVQEVKFTATERPENPDRESKCSSQPVVRQ